MSGRGTGDREGTETILYSTVTTDMSLYNCQKLQNIQQKGRDPNVKPWTLGNKNVSTLAIGCNKCSTLTQDDGKHLGAKGVCGNVVLNFSVSQKLL